MNKTQIEVARVSLEQEKQALESLKDTYSKATKDITKKIEKLVSRADAESTYVVNQINALTAQRGAITGILNNLKTEQYRTVSEYLHKSYENGFIGSLYSLQKQGVPLIFPINQNAVTKAITVNSKLSVRMYEKMEIDVNQLNNAIRRELSSGLANAGSFSDVAHAINNSMSTGLFKAQRIARTEGSRVYNESKMDAMHDAKEAGADILKRWDSTLDGSTRPHHQELDGQIRELDEPFVVPSDSSLQAMSPCDFGEACEDINCRCEVLEIGRWEQGKNTIATKMDGETGKIIDLSNSKSYNEFKEKYKAELNTVDDSNFSNTYKDLKHSVERWGNIDYNPISEYDKIPLEKNIIKAVGGGDETDGSCASLALAYVGQKNGLNVLDYRDGDSREFFSIASNFRKIASLNSTGTVETAVARSYMTSGKHLLQKVEADKEYLFACGSHASIIRKNSKGVLQYLELQHPFYNGWTDFEKSIEYTLKDRFDCTKYAGGRDVTGILVDIDKFKNSKEFNVMLGYINTNADKQVKGLKGFAK